MAPGAVLDDGLLDLVIAPEVSRASVLLLLIQLIRGRHIKDPRLTFQRATRLDIESTPGTPIHADGEILVESATRVCYEILPGKITLITP